MPDFNRDLSPKIALDKSSDDLFDLTARSTPSVDNIGYREPDLSAPENPLSWFEKASQESLSTRPKGILVSDATMNQNRRYSHYNPTINNQEDYLAYGQSNLDKAANGLLKGLGLAATTVAGGFATVYGAGKSVFTGRLADIWDNEGMRTLDAINEHVDNELLPNYYTDVEKNAEWYSTDNWFKTNFLFDKLIKNSGFAVGAMVSGNVFNAGLLRAGAGIGRAAMAGATAAEASQAFKLFTPLLKNTARAFSQGKNIEAAAILEKNISSIADLTAKSSELAKIATQFNKFANIGEEARRTAIAIYSSAGEASFEALQTAKEYKNSLIEKYKEEHYGEEPDANMLQQIEAQAESVGKTAFLGNMALLSATEYVQLPYLLGSSYKASKQASNSFSRTAQDVVLEGGEYAAKKSSTIYGKLLDKASGTLRYIFDPKEMGQEIGQYALQVGTQNYYNKAYKTNDANAWTDGFLYGLVGKDERGEGVGALVSKEGIEGGILGGITGGLMQAKQKYQEYKAIKGNTTQFLSQLNDGSTFKESFKDRLKSVNRGIILQEQEQDAVMVGDQLEARDLHTDQMHNYLSTRIKYGRMDMVMDDINDLRLTSSSAEGLASLKQQGYANINDTTLSYHERLNKLESFARNTDEFYKATYLRYGGEVIPGTDQKLYSSEVMDKMVYAMNKIADYDVRIPQLNASLAVVGIPTMDVLNTITTTKKPNKEATKEALKQINALDVTSDVKDELKTSLRDVMELSLRRKLFLEEYDDIKNNPLNYTELTPLEPKEETVVIKQTEAQEGTKRKKVVEKEIEVGREYSLTTPVRREGNVLQLAPKIGVISKTLGGEYEVVLPSGDVVFMAPKEFKPYSITEEDNSSEEIKDLLYQALNTVISSPEFTYLGTAQGDLLEFVNDQDDVALTNAVEKEFNILAGELIKEKERQKEIERKLIENKEKITIQQGKLETLSGNNPTGDPSKEDEGEELALKAAPKIYKSSTTVSEGSAAKPATEPIAPHVQRSMEFLNKAAGFKNRSRMRAILVTPKHLSSLGLEGLVQLSYKVDASEDVKNIPGALESETGFVAQVFVVQEADGLYFVDKDGKKLNKVGEKTDLNKVIFQTMPTPSLTYADGSPRYRKGEKEIAEQYSEAWKKYRKELFSSEDDKYPVFKFSISRGFPNKIEINGKPEINAVGGILVPEKEISKYENLIVIPTTGSVSHQGELLKFPNGRPVLQYGDTVEFLQNRKFTKNEIETIYTVIDKMVQEFNSTLELNPLYTSYLLNTLFWKSTKNPADNQLFLNEETMMLHIGKESFPLSNISSNKAQILEALSKAYHSVNNKSLSDLTKPFYELYLEGDKLEERKWDNYQTYLLASTYPDGSARSANSIPLYTHVAKPTEAVPYAFKQKYSILDLTLAIEQVKPKEEEKKEEPKEASVLKIGPYVIDSKTKNKITLADPFNDVEFISSTNETGAIAVLTATNAAIKKIANDSVLSKKYIEGLKAFKGNVDSSLSNEELILQFLNNVISLKLIEIRKNAVVETPKEETPKEQPKEEPKAEEPKPEEKPKMKGPSDLGEFRMVGPNDKSKISEAEIQLFKQWVEDNVPNIPYEILENIITIHDGEKAWGVFEQGIAKFYKGAIRGTEYHEVFEAIWKGMLSEEQRAGILNEFKSKTGTFIDRASGKTIQYSASTDKEAKERIADDFADYRVGKLPARSLGDLIRNFFKSIIDFFKSFVSKPSMKEQLFNAIDTGVFKKKELSSDAISDVSEYRAVEGLSEQETHDFVQDMTARAAGIMFAEAKKKLLFSPEGMTSAEIFSRIKDKYQQENKIAFLGEKAWEDLVSKTKEYLRTLGIQFNEEDKININNEGTNQLDYAPKPFSVDWKKNSTAAIKFTLSTLLQVEASNQTDSLSLSLPKVVLSQLKGEPLGYKLVNFSKAFSTMLSKLSNTTSVSDAVNKFKTLVETDASYVRLFQRMGGNLTNKTIPFDEFDVYDWKLFIQFYQTFTRQKPDALIQYVNGGEVYTAPANLDTPIKLLQSKWIENIKALAKNQKSLIFYNSDSKMYRVNPETIAELPVPKTAEDMISFLSKIGIMFPMETYLKLSDEGRNNQVDQFNKAVSAIYSTLSKEGDLYSISSDTLAIGSRLSKIAELLINVENPNQDSTYMGLEKKRLQSFADNNAASLFENEFNESSTLEELLQKRPELLDTFSQNSQILKKGGMYFDKEGNRIRDIKVEYIQGTNLVEEGEAVPVDKMSLGRRYTQEINQNINGSYYVLIPADSQTEWMMNLGNQISYEDFASGRAWKQIFTIFKGYLIDDINIALDNKERKKIKNVGKRAKELRFFKDILSEKDLSEINNMIDEEFGIEEFKSYITKNSKSIEQAIGDYLLNNVAKTQDILHKNSQLFKTLVKDKVEFSFAELDSKFADENKLNKYSLSQNQLTNVLSFVNTNYIINNIEYHKILFGDPFQFRELDGQLEETKRIKSFLSPRRTTFDSPELNNFLDREYNVVSVGILDGQFSDYEELKPEDPGYHEYKSFTKTITLQDVNLVGSLVNVMSAYGKVNETDGASWLMDNTYKEIKIKNGQWSDEAEAFHQWQMAYTRQNMPGYVYTSEKLKEQDAKTVSKPSPTHKIEVLKPIVSGFKNNKPELVLDKFSQMPIYFSMVKGTNLENIYIQMFKDKAGYAIVESGRKVGVDSARPLYNQDGTFNTEAISEATIVDVPWKTYGIQVETTSEGEKQQTRGSQLTKLASIDLFNNGETVSEEAIDEYLRNVDILNKLHDHGYKELLNKLGIVDLGDGFTMPDGTAVSEALVHEMLRREMSDNAKETIQLDENNQFKIPLEASPSYVQIRDIIYSMIDKAILSPKMNGGPKVQVPVTMWENKSKGRSLIFKFKEGWRKISKKEYEAMSEEDKAKVRLSDDTLKFYTKEKPYIEVLLPHWFREKLDPKAFKTDADLLNYLNSSPEGRSILKGIAFRIPTQSLSSAEVFVVKGFLPQYMGDTIVVPSEITTKAGSDFDIDKLNTYLKNIYLDKKGNIRLVKYLNSEEETKAFFEDVYRENTLESIKKLETSVQFKEQLFDTLLVIENATSSDIIFDTEEQRQFFEDHKFVLQQIINLAAEEEISPTQFIQTQIEELGEVREKLVDKLFNHAIKDKYLNDMYKKSLENEYYDSLQNLLTLPENFEKLISPVDDAGLEQLSKDLDILRGVDETTIKNRILDRNFMTQLRHAFILGKNWIGNAAVNLTHHSLTQKTKVYLDPARFANVTDYDKQFLGDGNIVLPHNEIYVDEKPYVSMSAILDKTGKYISRGLSGYITSFVDVAKNPYILKVIQSKLAVGTFMFLQRIGVPMKTSAMFMNQPIISEYLTYLDNTDARGLFSIKNISLIRQKFPATEEQLEEAEINLDTLEDNIKEYYSGTFSPTKNAEQQLILTEFLKYAKMAQYSFKLSQAINYDTTKFRSGDSFLRKQSRTSDAIETNIFTSVKDILDNSPIGVQEQLLSKSVTAMGEIFKLDRPEFRKIIQTVLQPYTDAEFLSTEDYERIANKIRTSFLDFIFQTKGGYNTRIEELLKTTETSVASQLPLLQAKYPSLNILDEMQVTSTQRPNGTKSVRVIANVRGAYEENRFTGMLRELRDYNSQTNAFYKDLVTLSILQGSGFSPISIKNIIPIEDYSEVVAPIIETLVVDKDVAEFSKGWFERNNWKNEDFFYKINQLFFWKVQNDPITVQENQFGDFVADIFQYKSGSFAKIPSLNILASSRKVLLLDEKYDHFAVQNKFIKIPRIIINKQDGEMLDMRNAQTLTKLQLAVAKKKGNFAFQDVYGYQKVMLPSGEPLKWYEMNDDGSIKAVKHVYKLINLYGDGILASEYYDAFVPSALDNGTIKVEQEISDEDLINFYGEAPVTASAPVNILPEVSSAQNPELFPTEPKEPMVVPQFVTINLQPDNREKIVKGEKTTTIRTQKEFEYIGLPIGATAFTTINAVLFEVTNRGLFSIEEVGKEAILNSEGLTSAEDFKFPTSKKWFEGEGKLYIYDFKKVEEENISSSETPSILELRATPINYTKGQEKALLEIEKLIQANKQAYYLLAGYAGTGKTTIAENIAKLASASGKQIKVLAPTNKAATVLNDKLKSTGVGSLASTIHKAIYGEPNEFGEWVVNAKIQNSVLIIDESSMIEKELMKDLIDNTKNNNILVFMGDSFQLEQIGQSSELFSALKSPEKMTNNYGEPLSGSTELTEVKRQSLDSNVLKLATISRIDNKAYIPSESMEDFEIVPSKNEFVNKFKDAMANDEDAVVVVATNNERIIMNNVARIAKFGEDRAILEDGESLIAIANSTNVSNSEIFKAVRIVDTPIEHTVAITFGDKTTEYPVYLSYVMDEKGIENKVLFLPTIDKPSLYHAVLLKAIKNSNRDLYNQLDNDVDIFTNKKGVQKLSPAIVIATYGYSMTAHKSQGSQWNTVFVNQNYNAEAWNPARWYYTAITRSAKNVIVHPSKYNTKISPEEINKKIEENVEEDVVSLPIEQFETEFTDIVEFLQSLPKEKLDSLGSIETLIEEYKNVPFEYTQQDFINELKCRI